MMPAASTRLFPAGDLDALNRHFKFSANYFCFFQRQLEVLTIPDSILARADQVIE